MFCGFCGEELPEDSNICEKCGKATACEEVDASVDAHQEKEAEKHLHKTGDYIYVDDRFWQQKGAMQTMTFAALFTAALSVICAIIYPVSAFFLTTAAVIVSLIALKREMTALTMLAMILSIISGILAFLKAVAEVAAASDLAAAAAAAVSSLVKGAA